jgi:hypothetical protein
VLGKNKDLGQNPVAHFYEEDLQLLNPSVHDIFRIPLHVQFSDSFAVTHSVCRYFVSLLTGNQASHGYSKDPSNSRIFEHISPKWPPSYLPWLRPVRNSGYSWALAIPLQPVSSPLQATTSSSYGPLRTHILPSPSTTFVSDKGSSLSHRVLRHARVPTTDMCS